MGVIEFILLKMASLPSKAKIDCVSVMLAEQEVLVRGNLQTIWMKPLVWSACTLQMCTEVAERGLMILSCPGQEIQAGWSLSVPPASA